MHNQLRDHQSKFFNSYHNLNVNIQSIVKEVSSMKQQPYRDIRRIERYGSSNRVKRTIDYEENEQALKSGKSCYIRGGKTFNIEAVGGDQESPEPEKEIRSEYKPGPSSPLLNSAPRRIIRAEVNIGNLPAGNQIENDVD